MLKNIIPNKNKALFLAKKQLSELVYDAVNLEGINYTLPEVQTLLDGVTVGGHRVEDQHIVFNQINAWYFLFNNIEHNTFSLSTDFVLALHNISAKEEALKWGMFRQGGVNIAGTSYLPPSADKLPTLWDEMLASVDIKNSSIDKTYTTAISIFLNMSRYQFFYDVNKRTGRLMMNGILLSNGLPAINLTAKKQLEFNQLMLEFYQTNDQKNMQEFMRSFIIGEKVIEIMSEPNHKPLAPTM